MFRTSCILAVTFAAASFQPAPALSPELNFPKLEAPGLAAGARSISDPSAAPRNSDLAPAARPKARGQIQPAAGHGQEAAPSDVDVPAAEPADEDEVLPGSDPASCDGCELAGSLWGLFLFSRRKGIPRPHIRGIPIR